MRAVTIFTIAGLSLGLAACGKNNAQATADLEAKNAAAAVSAAPAEPMAAEAPAEAPMAAEAPAEMPAEAPAPSM